MKYNKTVRFVLLLIVTLLLTVSVVTPKPVAAANFWYVLNQEVTFSFGASPINPIHGTLQPGIWFIYDPTAVPPPNANGRIKVKLYHCNGSPTFGNLVSPGWVWLDAAPTDYALTPIPSCP